MDAIKSRCSRRKPDEIHCRTLENFLEKPDTHKANISKNWRHCLHLTCEKRQMPLTYDMLFKNQYKKYEYKIKHKHKKTKRDKRLANMWEEPQPCSQWAQRKI